MNAAEALSAGGVQRGLRSLLLGRACSGLLGLAWLAALARHLPVEVLASYFAALALLEIAQLASGVGLLAWVQRFLPVDVRALGRRGLARQLLGLLAWRLLTLALAAAVLAGLWSVLVSWVGPALAGVPLRLFLPLLGAEGLVRLNEVVLENLLLQGQRQALALGRNVLRLAGLAALLGAGLDAPRLLLLELVAATVLALLGLALLARRVRAQPVESAPAAGARAGGPLRERLGFALPAHAALVLGLVAGPDLLKLLVGAAAGPGALAAFGLALAVADMAARHLPAPLLLDYVRALLTAGGGAGGRPGTPVPAADWFWPRLLLRINGLALVALLAWMLGCGDAARRVFAAGGLPPGLWPCLALLGAMLFVQAFRLMAGLVAHLQADSRSVLWATLATWCAPPLVLGLAPALGAPAGALGLLVVELGYAAVLKRRLRLQMRDLLGEPRFWGRAFTAGALAAACGWAACQWGGPPQALATGTLALLASYALLLWRLAPWSREEAQALLQGAPRLKRPSTCSSSPLRGSEKPGSRPMQR